MINLAQLALQNAEKCPFFNINKGLLYENHHYQMKQYTNATTRTACGLLQKNGRFRYNGVLKYYQFILEVTVGIDAEMCQMSL